MWEIGTHPRLEARSVDLARVRVGAAARGGARATSRALHARSSVREPRTLRTRLVDGSAMAWWRSGCAADAFGRYGVRLLVGGAVLVGAGLVATEHVGACAAERRRRSRGCVAPAGALTLWEVGYAAQLEPFAGIAPRVPECRRSWRWIRPGRRRRTGTLGASCLASTSAMRLAQVLALPNAGGAGERLQGLEPVPGEPEHDGGEAGRRVGDGHTLMHIVLRPRVRSTSSPAAGKGSETSTRIREAGKASSLRRRQRPGTRPPRLPGVTRRCRSGPGGRRRWPRRCGCPARPSPRPPRPGRGQTTGSSSYWMPNPRRGPAVTLGATCSASSAVR
jgi:hypothetical protein